MLTDVFFRRYKDVEIASSYGESYRALFVQACLIINKQLFPTYAWDGKLNEKSKSAMLKLHDMICMELGVTQLSQKWYSIKNNWNGNVSETWRERPVADVVANFMNEPFQDNYSADKYVKFRLSIIELAFRLKETQIQAENDAFPAKLQKAQFQAATAPQSRRSITLPGNPADGLKAQNAGLNTVFKANVDEINERLRQAGLAFSYHNGFIQGSDDTIIRREVENPFWQICSDPTLKNVDTDMKEALDLRDTQGRDPAFFAAKALESTIKIVSGRKGWTRGNEKGAADYIDNLMSAKNGRFISVWEGEALKAFFGKVRNPFGHGPGEAPMPELNPQQTDWSIEYCMSWIKSLVRRM